MKASESYHNSKNSRRQEDRTMGKTGHFNIWYYCFPCWQPENMSRGFRILTSWEIKVQKLPRRKIRVNHHQLTGDPLKSNILVIEVELVIKFRSHRHKNSASDLWLNLGNLLLNCSRQANINPLYKTIMPSKSFKLLFTSFPKFNA